MTQEEKNILAWYNNEYGASFDETNWMGNIDWEYISVYYNSLSEAFIEKFAERLNWIGISRYQKLSEPFIERNAERLDWEDISGFQSLSEPFIKKHANRLIGK